ncbi:MAG: hypothetical protein K5840_03810, partial [Eubacterium sp.]|nr:hypothetical protein [Eubacterium sp.]
MKNKLLAVMLAASMSATLFSAAVPVDVYAAPSGSSQGGTVNTTGLVDVSSNVATVDSSVVLASGVLTTADSSVTISGWDFTSGDYATTAVSALDSDVTIKDSSITMNVDEEVTDSSTFGVGAIVGSGTLKIKDSDITVNGAGRYTIHAYDSATMVVNSSSIIAGGDLGANGNTSSVREPGSNNGLYVCGVSRSNMSEGSSATFYYNSLCVAEGWAALSTDSANNGFEFVGYNTEAVAQHGGYGIYADSSCDDYLYGVDFCAAEIGAIISNNGSITVDNTDAAKTASTGNGVAVLSNLDGEEVSSNEDSVIMAGRNGVMLHQPGSTNSIGVLSLSNTEIITNNAINSDTGYSYTSSVNGKTYDVKEGRDYTEKYSAAVGAYIDFVKGAGILVKSSNVDIDLDDVTFDSYSNVAIMTVLNSDTSNNYLSEGNTSNTIEVDIKNSTIDGDFDLYDYQRVTNVTVSGSTL